MRLSETLDTSEARITHQGAARTAGHSLSALTSSVGEESEVSGVSGVSMQSSSSYTVSGSKTTEDLIPYTTDTMTSAKEKTNSLPKLINLEHRPPSQCSSPTSSGQSGHNYLEMTEKYFNRRSWIVDTRSHLCLIRNSFRKVLKAKRQILHRVGKNAGEV